MNTAPSNAVAYFFDSGTGYSSYDRERVRRHPLRKQLADVYHLFCGQFAAWLLFSTQVYKTRFPLVLGVARKTYPLKVFWRVVGLVTVDVVDRQAIGVSWNKGHCHKTVERVFDSLPALCRSNLKIPAFCNAGRKQSLREKGGKRLLLSTPGAAVRHFVSRRFYLPIRGNEPAHTFGFNFSPNRHVVLKL